MKVVTGRKCGQCTVCCRVPPIRAKGLVKAAGVLCEHCVEGAGCTIYRKRPNLCRDFYCGWRMFPDLDDSWRPDRSGVLIVEETEDIPAQYRTTKGVKFVVDGPDGCVLNKKFLLYLASLILQAVPCFLAVPGPAGHAFAKALVNDRLAQAARTGDGHTMVAVLQEVLGLLRGGTFEPEPQGD